MMRKPLFLYSKQVLRTLLLCSMLLPLTLAARQNDALHQPGYKKVSVTSLPYNDDSSIIRFAIISDLWGGLRPRIFEDAVDKIGLLQPQFVMSVGDLVYGKLYDSTLIKDQWDEFDAAIRPLSMPFYYVPGNHDISNAVMEAEWKKRLGSPYYHFIYKNTLFLCINTEDGGRGGIRDEQVAYFKKVIEENKAVRWTFLFMHRPVWQGKDNRQEGYEKIEALLNGRTYTLFSGHHHTYLSTLKNGNKHFVLGSTGGGSDLRGEQFGEFDHITMVTLGKGAPHIVNLKLDGIIKEDVVNEQKNTITQTLINQTWIKPVAYVSAGQKQLSIPVEVQLKNPTAYPVVINNIAAAGGVYKISPADLQLTLAPGQELTRSFTISRNDRQVIDLASLTAVQVPLTATYIYEGLRYSLPAEKKWLLSWKMTAQNWKLSAHTKNIFYNRDTANMITLTAPEQLTGPWYWSGPDDARVRFKVMQEGTFAHVLLMVNDDQWVSAPAADRDIVYVHLEDADGRKQVLSFSPGDQLPAMTGSGNLAMEQLQSTIHYKNGLLLIDYKLPLAGMLKPDGSLRINIGYRDQDLLPEKQVATLFWKPVWGSTDDYKNSGSFLFRK